MKYKYLFKIAYLISITLFFTKSLKSQTLTAGDIAIIGVSVDNEEVLLVTLANVPSGESVFFTDDEWGGTAFNSGEGFYKWVTPAISAGTTFTINTGSSSVGGTITNEAGSLAFSNSGDGFFLYQTTTNVYNTGTYTILGFAGEDSGDAGTLNGTGLVIGTNAIYFGGDNGIYNDARTANNKNGHLANVYDNTKWATSGTAQVFDTTNFTVDDATTGITLGTVSNNTNESGITATFTAVLNLQPASDVVLNITSANTGEITVSPASLTFTNGNWDTPQTITATGIDDSIQDGSIIVTITVSVDSAASDDDYDGISETKDITNEDNELTDLVINEVLADPDITSGDANGDGSSSTTDDEFLEIYNSTGAALDISGYKLSDGAQERHVFPAGTIIPTDGTIVVFGAGNPTGIAGLVQVASTGTLGLNNGGDTITILNASDDLVVAETYGAAGNNQSIAREPDFTGSFVDHSTIATNTIDYSPGRDNTDNIPFIKTWSGATDNDWLTATNWLENAAPTSATDNVIIYAGLTNYPTSTAAVTINSLIIESGATLIATNTFTTTTSTTYKRTLANGSQWYMMSSPVVGETYDNDWAIANSISNGSVSSTNVGVSTYDVIQSDPTTGPWTYLQTNDTNSGTFNVSKGYGINRSSNGIVSFTGSGIYTTNQVYFLNFSAGKRYNLVGNPFTAYLNLGDFNNENELVSIIDDFFFWNGSSYITKSIGTDNSYEIAPGQGFFVQALEPANVQFNIADVSHQSTETFQKSANLRPEIHLIVNDGSKDVYARFLYIDGTTKGFDAGYDGKLFGGVTHSFVIYSDLVVSDGKKYQSQSLPNSDFESMIVPIGLIVEADKEITFTAESINLPSGIKVILEDRENNTFTDLSNTNNYTFTTENALNGVGRFYLHTRSSVLSVDTNTLNTVRVFNTDNMLHVSGLTNTKTSVKVFNILGKKVINTSFKTSNGLKEINLPKLSAGVYIIQVENENGKLNKKIILN